MTTTVKNLHEFGPQITTCVADPILDEDGDPILDESGNALCPESVIPVYTTTAKSIIGYTPDFQRYYRSDMWPTDNGSLFTFAAFLRMGDQPGFLNNREILYSLNNSFLIRFREWDDFTDAGGDTNRFISYLENESGNGWSGFHLSESTHGIDSGDWFALMISMDYSGVTPVIEYWVQKKGDSAATDIFAGLELGSDSGPITFAWDDTSIVTSIGINPNDLTNQGNYDISEIFITNEAVDWSVEANRLKFVDINGKPVGLGAIGSDLTGTPAKHYAPDGDLTNNKGTESNWSEFGTILDASTSPTD